MMILSLNKKVSSFFLVLFLPIAFCFAGSQIIEQASEAQKNIIQAALGNQYPIKQIACVKSAHHKKAYYIAAVFYAEGVGNITGIWLVGGEKNKPNLVYSVDGVAHQFSGMRKASETKAAAYISDPEVDLLRGHFRK